MSTETLAIRWKNQESRDYTDVFPVSVFANVGGIEELTHDVIGPKGGSYHARCSVVVQATIADLNYEAFPAFNKEHGMYLGILRLHFTDQDRTGIARAEWRPQGRKRFEPAEVAIVEYALPQLQPYKRPKKAGKRVVRAVNERPGQVKFRALLKRVYNGHCCVTGCEVGETLDGAHIDPYISRESDHPQNGMLLRKDLHCLFDSGLMGVEPRSRKVYFAAVSLSWPEYRRLHGRARLREPAYGGIDYRPDDAALQRAWSTFRAVHGPPSSAV